MRSSMNWLIEFRLRRQRKEWPLKCMRMLSIMSPQNSPSTLDQLLLVSVISFLNKLEVGVAGGGYEEHLMVWLKEENTGHLPCECTLPVPTQAVPLMEQCRHPNVTESTTVPRGVK